MYEQTKSAQRRSLDSGFRNRYLVGKGIDVGAGADPLRASSVSAFPGIIECMSWDIAQGDAQTLNGIDTESLDFLHASHVLEHLRDPVAALSRWIEVIRSGGHIIVVVPDAFLYERGHWPSRFSSEHKWRFCIDWPAEDVSINCMQSVLELVRHFSPRATLEHLKVVRDHFDPTISDTVDQTMGPAECSLEFVLRRI